MLGDIIRMQYFLGNNVVYSSTRTLFEHLNRKLHTLSAESDINLHYRGQNIIPPGWGDGTIGFRRAHSPLRLSSGGYQLTFPSLPFHPQSISNGPTTLSAVRRATISEGPSDRRRTSLESFWRWATKETSKRNVAINTTT
jgi:hypothetical protein